MRARQCRERARARAARTAAAKAQRAALREKLGALRDRVIRASTRERYLAHTKAFFLWVSRTGRVVPATVEDFDTLCCAWAEHLWHEGDPKCMLNNSLCGLAHFCPGLRSKLNGAWRLYKAWGRSEPVTRAPPLTVGMAQAMAGHFASNRLPSLAVMTLIAHHCMLRTCELFELRTGDVTFLPGRALLVLRETKMGQRVGIHQETTVADEWLLGKLRTLHARTRRGCTLLGVSPAEFRKHWRLARIAAGVPPKYTPYSLRRGGATCMFQHCGSFDQVADKGRWGSLAALRLYITTALAEMASDAELNAMQPKLLACARQLSQL